MLKRKRELEKEKEPEKKKGKGGLLGFGLIKKENFRLGNKGKNKEEEKKFKAEEEEKKDEGMNLVDQFLYDFYRSYHIQTKAEDNISGGSCACLDGWLDSSSFSGVLTLIS